jgi:dipeptidyl aminopeptidase/acylaminoacyl peptidase
MKTLILFFIVLFSGSLSAQLPNTDIWLLDIKSEKDTIILSNPINVTNRTGYDNQPAFSPDGKYLLYTSIRDEKQSDIYKYDLKTKKISQFTNTPTTSEYSPTFMPDGKNISVVMVEPDSAQRLWKLPIKGGTPSLIMDKVDSIGYHCWLDSNNVALFLITNPFQLIFTNIRTQKSTYIVHDTIARGMNLITSNKKREFFYSYKGIIYSIGIDEKNKSDGGWFKKYDGEDFTFLNNRTMVMADKSRIYINKFRTSEKLKGNTWLEIKDLSKEGIKKITRIAVSTDGTKMAIVAE